MLVRRVLLLILVVVCLLGVVPVQADGAGLHLALGNPSDAVSDPAQAGNYLIMRDQYALAYQRDRGIPRWVSWHLEADDLGDVERYEGDFFTDASLPEGWYRVTHDDYTNSGYNRGHLTPSADRRATEADNEATFILSNVVPQNPTHNQVLWRGLEEDSRDLVEAGNELYIIAGVHGSQGTLSNGKLDIPAVLWKVILVLPAAEGDDAARVTAESQVIAVWTPNSDAVDGAVWQDYTITVQCVEQRTGLDFFDLLVDSVEQVIEGTPCAAGAPGQYYLPLLSLPGGSTPPSPAAVRILEVLADPPGDDVLGEYVLVRNEGGTAADLTNWTLRDQAGATYVFPAFSLVAGSEVRIWVGSGSDDTANLYWGRASAVWNNNGDTAILRDADEREIARFVYP